MAETVVPFRAQVRCGLCGSISCGCRMGPRGYLHRAPEWLPYTAGALVHWWPVYRDTEPYLGVLLSERISVWGAISVLWVMDLDDTGHLTPVPMQNVEVIGSG